MQKLTLITFLFITTVSYGQWLGQESYTITTQPSFGNSVNVIVRDNNALLKWHREVTNDYILSSRLTQIENNQRFNETLRILQSGTAPAIHSLKDPKPSRVGLTSKEVDESVSKRQRELEKMFVDDPTTIKRTLKQLRRRYNRGTRQYKRITGEQRKNSRWAEWLLEQENKYGL